MEGLNTEDFWGSGVSLGEEDGQYSYMKIKALVGTQDMFQLPPRPVQIAPAFHPLTSIYSYSSGTTLSH